MRSYLWAQFVLQCFFHQFYNVSLLAFLFCNDWNFYLLIKVLAIERFELSTLALLARCSNRLSYTAVNLDWIELLNINVVNRGWTASWFSFLQSSKTTIFFSHRTWCLWATGNNGSRLVSPMLSPGNLYGRICVLSLFSNVFFCNFTMSLLLFSISAMIESSMYW